ncbi:MAG: hypothetical protein V1790_07645 [Planctomycetota bacterium]
MKKPDKVVALLLVSLLTCPMHIEFDRPTIFDLHGWGAQQGARYHMLAENILAVPRKTPRRQ